MTELSQIELKLPESESVVMMRKQLTIGQSRELQRILLRGGKLDIAAGSIGEISGEVYMDMQDTAASFLITEIKDKDGNSHQFSNEWLFGLSSKDGDAVYEKINQITSESTLGSQERKNS